jgi:hypothetical protein
MRRIATGRIVGLFIAILGLSASAWWARDAVRMYAELDQWLIARPMETAIDLSQPGEIARPFHQTCNTSCKEALYLECSLDAQQNVQDLFKGLSGSVVIKDLGGKEIKTVPISDESVSYWQGKLILAQFTPFLKGDYVATIHIDSGAPALIDKQQTLYAKYELCGLERMPAMIVSVGAFGAGLIGIGAAVCVWPRLVRSGIQRNEFREAGK